MSKPTKLRVAATVVVLCAGLATMGLLVWPWDLQTKAQAKIDHQEIRTEINVKIEKQDAVLKRLDDRVWKILEAVKK